MRTTWFYEIGAPSNPKCIGSTKATTASEAWQRVWAKAQGRPCRMARSRKVQSIDRGRTALAAVRTVRKVGSDGVTEYMADGGMSAEALYLLVIHGDVEPELLRPVQHRVEPHLPGTAAPRGTLRRGRPVPGQRDRHGRRGQLHRQGDRTDR